MPKSPHEQKLYGHVRYFLMFGSGDAVAHSDIPSRTLTDLINKICAMPLVGYFSDFGGIIPIGISEEALGASQELRAILRIDRKIEKPKWGLWAQFLGLGGCAACSGNRWGRYARLTPGGSQKWADRIKTLIKTGSVGRT